MNASPSCSPTSAGHNTRAVGIAERKDDLPIVFAPSDQRSTKLSAWLQQDRAQLLSGLRRQGAVLLRGFETPTLDAIDAVCEALGSTPMAYTDRVTRRSPVRGAISTATDTPRDFAINLHSENTFAATWPTRLVLGCRRPPTTGGRTPLADTRRVLARLPAKVRQRFETRGVRYVRNFGAGPGMGWRQAFQVNDRQELEDRVAAEGIELQWGAQDTLRTVQIRPAIVQHPVTGEACWFNHASALNVQFMDPALRDVLVGQLGPDNLPHHTTYGDGQPIEDGALQAIRSAFEAETRCFDWQPGDILVLDNLLMAHGREPFTGDREVVAMLMDPCSWSEVEHSGTPQAEITATAQMEAPAKPRVRNTPAAGDNLQSALLFAVKEVLELDDLTLQDDFLDLGGDSLSAARVISRVREETGHELSLVNFFDATSLLQLLEEAGQQ